MKTRVKELNLPNFLTILRVISVPFFIFFLLDGSQFFRFIAFILFSLASLTDLIDGYLARKWKQETELGKFLDPLADKTLVLGALITLLFLSDQIKVWMVLCIIFRDMLITMLRYLAIQRGSSLVTSRLGKFKTVFQMCGILVILISLFLVTYGETGSINQVYHLAAEKGIDAWSVANQNLIIFINGKSKSIAYGLASFLPFYVMFITTLLTIVSGLRYLFTNYELFWPLPRLTLRSSRRK